MRPRTVQVFGERERPLDGVGVGVSVGVSDGTSVSVGVGVGVLVGGNHCVGVGCSVPDGVCVPGPTS